MLEDLVQGISDRISNMSNEELGKYAAYGASSLLGAYFTANGFADLAHTDLINQYFGTLDLCDSSFFDSSSTPICDPNYSFDDFASDNVMQKVKGGLAGAVTGGIAGPILLKTGKSMISGFKY